MLFVFSYIILSNHEKSISLKISYIEIDVFYIYILDDY